jgi:arylsulfatase A-like enzyme
MLRLFVPVVFVAAAVGTLSGADPTPNFLVILADDVGRDAIGCYGGRSYGTPNVDRLAADGMRFDQGYVMPVCHPTRTTLLSGRYPFRQGNPRWGSYPSTEEDRTVAALLHRAGYATAVAGKWQLGLLKNDRAQPRRMGFDQSCLFGWHEGPRYWQPLIYQNGTVRKDVADRYGPDVYVEFLSRFMADNRNRPFFAFYSMALCHDVTDDLEAPVPYRPGMDRYEDYAEMMAAMDEHVGDVVTALDDLGLRDQTLVLFLGDNGTAARSIIRAEDGNYIRDPVYSETTWGRVQGGKGSFSDAGTRVPWIVRWPGTVPAGSSTDALVDGSDLLPTVLALAGVDVPRDLQIDGSSFRDVLTDPDSPGRHWVYAENRGESFVANRRWKLMSDGKLFDRQSHPLEDKMVTVETAESEAARNRLQQVAAELVR